MMFSESFPILSTPDLPRLLGFYRDALGFAETYRFPADGRPAYVALRLPDGSQLGIGESADPPTSPAAQRLDLCLYAADCDAAVAHLRANRATITSEPTDMPWGERAAHAEDPDGNRLLVLARLPGNV